MLVLSRKVGESISIGHGEITVTILDIRWDRVRIGVEAPKHISIHRDEIEKDIQRKEASGEK